MEFVHSFPRSCAGISNRESIIFAANSLELFIQNGPLLVPEIITIPKLEGSNQVSEQFHILQIRFCFTVFEQALIADHMKSFGPISITFDYNSVASFGAIPVFYFPNFKSTRDTNDLGLTLIHRLRLILSLIQDYRDLKELSYEEISSVLNIKLTQKEHKILKRVLFSFDKAIHMDDHTYNNMEGTIQSISELLYPTGRSGKAANAKLQYFAQREWRLLSDLRLGGKDVTEYLDNQTKKSVLNLNYDFFNHELEFQNNNFKRVDLIQRLTQPYRNQFIESITGIYSEQAYFDQISETLNKTQSSFPLFSI